MSNLFIDVTELSGWQGKLTGVPRVMDELSSRFNDGSTPVIFVAWDSQHAQFNKIDYKALYGAKSTEDLKTTPQAVGSNTKAVLTKKLKNLKKRSKLAQKVYTLSKRIVSVIVKPELTAKDLSNISPAKGDTLFILSDWHGDSTFIEEVVKLKKLGVKLAQFSHDMLPIIAPQYSGHATENFTKFARKIYPVCDVIICNSECTKKDIASWLSQQDVNVPSIEVVRLGDDFKKVRPSRLQDKKFNDVWKADKKFLLCVGTIEARKNHMLLYYVYKLAEQKGINLPNMVIVGRKGWLSEDVYEMMTKDPATKEKFVFLHNASDEELSWLYNNCLFSIYTSFYEGWGLPIAESIAYGVPCLSSNTSSMPEIAGDLINYFSPSSSDECLAVIQNLLRPSELAIAKRRIKGYKQTDWDDTFSQVSSVLRRISG